MPEWLFIYEHDFDALRDLAFEYVKSVVTRYRRVVKLWNVVAGVHAPGSFSLSFEQMIELTRLLVGQVKAVNPQAKTLVTVRLPFGEYLASPGTGVGQGVPPLLYAEMVAQSGIECDGIGVEIKTGVPRRGRYCRDLFQISAMLDRFSALGKPIFVTAVACPDRSSVAGEGNPERRRAVAHALDARAAGEVAAGGLPHGDEHSRSWRTSRGPDLSDFEAANTALPGSGLLDDMLRPKPAFETVQELRRLLRPQKPAAAPPKA